MRARRCLPVLYGVARFGLGVDTLADAVVDLLPSPDEVDGPPTYDLSTGLISASGEALDPDVLAAFVFKTEQRLRGERLAFVRVFAGDLVHGMTLTRLPGGETTRPAEVVRIMGGDVEPVERLSAGMIGGLVWPRDAESVPGTGETLAHGQVDVTIGRIDVPRPVIAVTVEAPDLEGHDRMHAALRQLCGDDPSLVLGVAPDTGQTLLSGMGELHLELAIERVARDNSLDLKVGQPQARVRHTVLGPGSGQAERSDVISGRGRVTVSISIRPLEGGLGDLVRYACPRPRRQDWREALEAGVRAGIGVDGVREISVVGVEATVDGVDIHGSDIAPVVFRDAARQAVIEALDDAIVVEAEPWVSLSVIVPEHLVGRIVGDLARRGARIRGSASRGTSQVLAAEAPLAKMIGYATELRSITGGRGVFSMEPIGYESVPT